jgi:hypothetical protein
MRLQDVRVFAAIASASDEKMLGSQAQAEWGSAPKQNYDYGRFFWLSWDVRGCLVVIFAVGGPVFGLIVPALLGCGLRLLTAPPREKHASRSPAFLGRGGLHRRGIPAATMKASASCLAPRLRAGNLRLVLRCSAQPKGDKKRTATATATAVRWGAPLCFNNSRDEAKRNRGKAPDSALLHPGYGLCFLFLMFGPPR